MIPLLLAIFWPPFAAASLRYRGPRAAILAGGLTAALCAAVLIVEGDLPAAAVAAVWLVAAAACGALSPPVGPSRRERRRELLRREMAWAPILDDAWEELDSTDMLVPVIKTAPKRVA